MAAAEDAFLSDVHLYTPFLRTGKDNVGMFRVHMQLDMLFTPLNSVTTLLNNSMLEISNKT